jgi:cell division septum initiation protein DivIVA
MKLTLKILGILLVLILALMVIIPYFFRNQIVERVKEEINKNVNAQVDFTGFNLSLFRSFPDFNFRLTELSVVNKAPFAGDTLAYIPQLSLTIDLTSVFKGDFEIKKIDLEKPLINLLVTEDGSANWDIAPESDEDVPVADADDVSSDMLITLRQLTINNGRLIYDDKSLVTYVQLDGLNHKLSGDFSMENTVLQTRTWIDEVTVFYENVKYLHKIDAELDAPINADLKNFIFTFNNSELKLNSFFLLFEGSFAILDNGDYSMMFTYSSKRTNFKDFLSLIPAIYKSKFADLNTSGNAVLNGNVKGVYGDESYPGFELNLLVNNGRFHYPELPKSVDEINIQTKVSFQGGSDFDELVVNVHKFSLILGGNRFGFSLLLRNPISDMYLKGEADGTINLSEIHQLYPLDEGDELKGLITAKMMFEGRMSAIENERYNDFKFMGSLLMEGFRYNAEMLNKPVEITGAQMNFSPQFVDLVKFNMKMGDNDFSATGKVENFIPYTLADGMLKGNLITNSNYFNVSDLLPESEETPADETDTTALAVIEIPGNIDFTMQSNFKTLMYDNIKLKNVAGILLIKDQAVILDMLNMEVLDGSILISGKYDTKEPANPVADFDMNISNIDIQQSYNTFGTIEKFAPIAQKTSGKFSAGFKVNMLLDNTLMPIYPSMNGGGNLNTTSIIVEDVKAMNKLSDLLRMPDLKRLRLDPVRLSFEFIDGKVHLKPFDVKYQDINANIFGWTSFDQLIDFDMVLTMPRSRFGSAANAVLDNLVSEANRLGTNFSLGEKINVLVKITGTVDDPVVKITPAESSGGSMLDDLRKKAEEELRKQKQKLEEEARKELEKRKAEARKKADKIIADADRQATKIMEEAQKQADAINRTAKESAGKLIEEAEKQAKNLEEDAKKRGPIAEIAGRKAAEQVRSEAKNKSDQLINEAKTRSDNLLREAGNQSDKVKANARKEADKLLE